MYSYLGILSWREIHYLWQIRANNNRTLNTIVAFCMGAIRIRSVWGKRLLHLKHIHGIHFISSIMELMDGIHLHEISMNGYSMDMEWNGILWTWMDGFILGIMGKVIRSRV